MSHSYSYY